MHSPHITGVLKAAALLSTLLALSSEALAYTTFKCNGVSARWPDNFGNPLQVEMAVRASPVSFPAGLWRDSLEDSIERVNKNPSRFLIDFEGYNNSVKRGDGVNQIWGSSSQTYWDYYSNPAAHAPLITDCFTLSGKKYNFFKETDVIVNYIHDMLKTFTRLEAITGLEAYTHEHEIHYNGIPVKPPSGTPELGKAPFRTLLIHEIIHTAGLNHENRWYSTQGLCYTHLHTSGLNAYAYVGADSSAGLRNLYGSKFLGLPDLSVAHFKFNEPWYAGEEYGHHRKTDLHDDGPYGGNPVGGSEIYSEAIIDSSKYSGYKVFRVRAGDVVRAQFTYENLGHITLKDVPIRFYLSSDPVIGPGDHSLGNAKLTLTATGHSTALVGVKIPAWVAPDEDYWIGVYIDPDSSLWELDEQNNTSWLHVHTPD